MFKLQISVDNEYVYVYDLAFKYVDQPENGCIP